MPFPLSSISGSFFLQKLNIDGNVTDNPKTIASFCTDFYTKLYESNYCEKITNLFLESLTQIKVIDTDLKESCDKPLLIREDLSAVERLK